MTAAIAIDNVIGCDNSHTHIIGTVHDGLVTGRVKARSLWWWRWSVPTDTHIRSRHKRHTKPTAMCVREKEMLKSSQQCYTINNIVQWDHCLKCIGYMFSLLHFRIVYPRNVPLMSTTHTHTQNKTKNNNRQVLAPSVRQLWTNECHFGDTRSLAPSLLFLSLRKWVKYNFQMIKSREHRHQTFRGNLSLNRKPTSIAFILQTSSEWKVKVKVAMSMPMAMRQCHGWLTSIADRPSQFERTISMQHHHFFCFGAASQSNIHNRELENGASNG